jgi:hypothetical protein
MRPEWLNISLAQAARKEEQSPERISRLVSRAITGFEAVLAHLCKRGRPARADADDHLQTEHELMVELLKVCSSLLRTVSLDNRQVRDLVVGAWHRLSGLPAMTKGRFCNALSLSRRTLYEWLRACPKDGSPAPRVPQAQQPPAPRRRRRRRSFDFDLVLPDTQLGADTTDIGAFGVPLKLIAAQDIGGRDEDLFDAVLVDEHESAERVVAVLTDALAGMAGAQVITDQGSPYMAKATKEALEALQVEHAPTREGDPCGKATLERAFRTAKDIARPLLSLTNQLAQAVPALKEPDLAKATVKTVFCTIIRAYQHGARAARAALSVRGHIDPKTLGELAAQSRELARATARSARLLLEHVHALYDLPGCARKFVNTLHGYPLAVLHHAERLFRAQVHRDDIRDRRSYFAAIVKRLDDEHAARMAWERAQQNDDARRDHAQREYDAAIAAYQQDPASWLFDALGLIATQWQPRLQALFADGVGLGSAYLYRALTRIIDLHGPDPAADILRGVCDRWARSATDRLGPAATAAVQRVALKQLARATARPTHTDASAAPPATLNFAGRFQRPSPPDPLPI